MSVVSTMASCIWSRLLGQGHVEGEAILIEPIASTEDKRSLFHSQQRVCQVDKAKCVRTAVRVQCSGYTSGHSNGVLDVQTLQSLLATGTHTCGQHDTYSLESPGS